MLLKKNTQKSKVWTFVCLGSWGDVSPCFALANALAKSDCTIQLRFVTHACHMARLAVAAIDRVALLPVSFAIIIDNCLSAADRVAIATAEAHTIRSLIGT